MLPRCVLSTLLTSASGTHLVRIQVLGRCKNPPAPWSKLPDIGFQRRVFWGSRVSHAMAHQAVSQDTNSRLEKAKLDPFAIVADEVSEVTNRLRSMVIAEVPELTAAAGYYFRVGAEGKRTCPNVLLLMASALHTDPHKPASHGSSSSSQKELRAQYQSIAAVTEIIHVATLIHDDVLDNADTRRGMESLNFIMGDKLAVLADGEIMQLSVTSEQRCNMEYYLQKSYCKTAALISNSCKAIAVLAGQTSEVSELAYQYGRNLGIAYQLIDDILDFTGTVASLGKASLSDIRQGIVTAPILFAMEEFPQLRKIVERGFENSSDVDVALQYLAKSQGIERTRELATEYAKRAAEAIEALPVSNDESVQISRQALISLAQKLITRTK